MHVACLTTKAYSNRDPPGCKTNSESPGSPLQGGNTNPCSFEPSSKIICSRVERLRVDLGSCNFKSVPGDATVVGCLLALTPTVELVWIAFFRDSAFSSNERHFRSRRCFSSSVFASFNRRTHASVASSVAARTACLERADRVFASTL